MDIFAPLCIFMLIHKYIFTIFCVFNKKKYFNSRCLWLMMCSVGESNAAWQKDGLLDFKRLGQFYV